MESPKSVEKTLKKEYEIALKKLLNKKFLLQAKLESLRIIHRKTEQKNSDLSLLNQVLTEEREKIAFQRLGELTKVISETNEKVLQLSDILEEMGESNGVLALRKSLETLSTATKDVKKRLLSSWERAKMKRFRMHLIEIPR